MVIAFAGKGSSGKSTIVASLVDALRDGAGRMLVIDADPHQSLCSLLRRTPRTTLGDLRTAADDTLTGASWTRTSQAEQAMSTQALDTNPMYPYHLLALGTWGRAGSQCTTNRVLGYALQQLIPTYDLTIIDHEAGLEHVGRFADLAIDRLVITATPDQASLMVADRIRAHMRTVQRPCDAIDLVLNRVQSHQMVRPELAGWLSKFVHDGVTYLGHLPETPDLQWSAHVSGVDHPEWTLRIQRLAQRWNLTLPPPVVLS